MERSEEQRIDVRGATPPDPPLQRGRHGESSPLPKGGEGGFLAPTSAIAEDGVHASAATARRGRAHFQTFSSLRHRDFFWLWLSNLFNASANWFQQFTVPWVVWDISHSPLWVAVAVGTRSFPFLFIGPFAGVFADRIDRRKLVLVVQSALAVVVFGFAVAVQRGYIVGNKGVIYVTVFSFITGVLHSLIQPMRQAMVANTVPRKDLGNAIALNSVAGNVARVVGPPLGGFLYAVLSPSANFFIQSGLFILMVLMVVPIRLPYREEMTARRASVTANLKQGFRYVASERVILHLLLLSFVSAIFAAPIIQIMPVITAKVLGEGPKVGGFLFLMMGIGGITGTFCFASMGGTFGRGGVGMIALILLSCSIIALGISGWLLVALAAMFCMGFSRIAFQINNNTLLQSTIPDGLRGRVMALYHLDHGFTPLAIIGVGAMAELLPTRLVVELVGGTSLALAVFAFVAFRDVRRMKEGQV